MQQWLQIARERAVVRRAGTSVVVVGALLITINHGDALLADDISYNRLLKIVLTILVPYSRPCPVSRCCASCARMRLPNQIEQPR
ncbi:MAG: nitrate/nitrite transporter NrtS [Chloroflexota bacterium]|nr:nitrate/nitrite transporter NrtS [Chloroflexota bacterium]